MAGMDGSVSACRIPLLSGVAAGRPVSGEELSPPWPRRGGRAINKMLRRHLIIGAAGVVGSTTAYFLTNTTPSAPATVASQHSIDGAASPPRLRRGESPPR